MTTVTDLRQRLKTVPRAKLEDLIEDIATFLYCPDHIDFGTKLHGAAELDPHNEFQSSNNLIEALDARLDSYLGDAPPPKPEPAPWKKAPKPATLDTDGAFDHLVP